MHAWTGDVMVFAGHKRGAPSGAWNPASSMTQARFGVSRDLPRAVPASNARARVRLELLHPVPSETGVIRQNSDSQHTRNMLLAVRPLFLKQRRLPFLFFWKHPIDLGVHKEIHQQSGLPGGLPGHQAAWD